MDAEFLSSMDRAPNADKAESFERLYRQYSGAVLRFATKCLGRSDVAEEITGDAFLALYRNLDRIDTNALPAWLYTVVRNMAASYWRRSVVERKYAVELEDRPRHAEPGMLSSILNIPELKPIHRTCLILRYAHDMERADIALRLGLTENQVKSYLQYGLELLRKNMAIE